MNSLIPNMITAGAFGVTALTVDGKVMTANSSSYYLNFSTFKDFTGERLITGVYSGVDYVVAKKADGGIKIECSDDAEKDSRYRLMMLSTVKGNIKKIICGFRDAFVLFNDGTVRVYGQDEFNQSKAYSWRDIVDIACATSYVIGLKKDGTVVACGYNSNGACNISGWKDICSIACGNDTTFGIKRDGTVVATGENDKGQCNVSDWTDIVKIASSYSRTIGLRKDGTVVACGDNEIYKTSFGGPCDVSKWTDIVDIICDIGCTLGLRKDGTVLFTGDARRGFADVTKWNDIIHIIATGTDVFGLKRDGTVVSCGSNKYDINSWKLFDNYETIDEDFAKGLEQRNVVKERKINMRCIHCGGKFKGLFSKTCTQCGRKKDY